MQAIDDDTATSSDPRYAAGYADGLLAGRRRGLQEAAGVGYMVCAETRHVTLGDKVRAAITALLTHSRS
jgi:hypothetical protein